MSVFTLERLAEVMAEYDAIETKLYTLGKIMQMHGFGEFKRYGKTESWYPYEIGQVNLDTKTIDVRYSALVGEDECKIFLRVPVLWLQVEDSEAAEEIKFHAELSN